jgi:hypothetical protein
VGQRPTNASFGGMLLCDINHFHGQVRLERTSYKSIGRGSSVVFYGWVWLGQERPTNPWVGGVLLFSTSDSQNYVRFEHRSTYSQIGAVLSGFD